MIDPDPKMSGKGIKKLEAAGIEVESDLYRDKARNINRVYLHYLETSRSWVNLKIALSLDGRTAAADGSSRWISCDRSRTAVHGMRASSGAVMTGAGTVRTDDPEMTVRLDDTPAENQPVRIVVSSTGDFGNSRKIFSAAGKTVIAVPEGVAARLASYSTMPDVEIWEFPPDSSTPGFNLVRLFEKTASTGIGEILCEAGSRLATHLLKAELVDSVSIFTAQMILGGEGKPAFGELGIDSIGSSIKLKNVRSRRSGSDFLTEGCVVYGSN